MKSETVSLTPHLTPCQFIEIYIAFQTAVTLALDEAGVGSIPVVKESHLRQVVKMSQSFKDYIKSTHGNMDGKIEPVAAVKTLELNFR